MNSSVVGVSQVSTVSSCPLGSGVQPSSSLGSFLPCPENVSQFCPVALNSANAVLSAKLLDRQSWHACASTYVPLASTSPWASPMFVQPGGGAICFHELVSGL